MLLGMGLALGVLGVTLFTCWWLVRDLVRHQILQRDAEALHATTLMEQIDALSLNGNEVRNEAQVGFDAAILASRLKGVLGIRFFDTNGVFTDSFPAYILPEALEPDAMKSVRALEPYSRFCPNTPWRSIFIYRPDFSTGVMSRIPILEVTVPLHRRDQANLAGAAQFVIEGQSIAAEYERLDHHLIRVFLLIFGVAGALLTLMIWPAFRRVEKLNQDLAARTVRLQRANEELALAARTSAIGAISAHLMHGLKNPLASLSQFVNDSQNDPGSHHQDEWQDASKAARRMQSLVEQTLEVLGDARGEPSYQIPVGELAAAVERRVTSFAAQRSVKLGVDVGGNCTLSSRTANLVSLVLVNLLENAIAATPAEGNVLLILRRENDRLKFSVRDRGPGFPMHLRDQLFLPCKSTREGGSGIGLAICKQIADHLGASLELTESDSNGCLFVMSLPLEVCEPA